MKFDPMLDQSAIVWQTSNNKVIPIFYNEFKEFWSPTIRGYKRMDTSANFAKLMGDWHYENFCVIWKETGRCHPQMIDLLIDYDLYDEARLANWAYHFPFRPKREDKGPGLSETCYLSPSLEFIEQRDVYGFYRLSKAGTRLLVNKMPATFAMSNRHVLPWHPRKDQGVYKTFDCFKTAVTDFLVNACYEEIYKTWTIPEDYILKL